MKYHDMDNSYREKTLDLYMERGFLDDSIEWCVTEKCHGSNFSVFVSKGGMKFARRESFLEEDEKFFSYELMVKKNEYRFINLYEQLNRIFFDVDGIIIFGELFGGNYPHPDVEKNNKAKKIQKGICYSPDIDFYAFDLCLVRGEVVEFLDYDQACSFFKKYGIFHARILFRGTFDECMEYPNRFATNIPKWLGYPEIEDNVCEGIVLKPIKSIRIGFDRVILKNKHEKTAEIQKGDKTVKIKSYPEKVENVMNLISDYINENRLRNVLSKFGEFEKNDFQEIHELFKSDVYADFLKDHDSLMIDFDENEKKIISKHVGKFCTKYWRPVFLKEQS